MPTISVRFSDEDARLVRRLRVERGCASVSALMRLALGLESPPQGGVGPPPSAETVASLLVRLVERVEALERATLRGLTRADRREVRCASEQAEDPEERKLREEAAAARAWAIEHPDEMPPGFETYVA